ncbi:MAG: NYN domain-containing protein [Rhizobiaceae bacterium]|nr:NYN domain-containing protein [Rhizobiaceae bacterium]
MVSDKRSNHLAVLIDADNASSKIAEALFAEIAKFGEADVRRVYGDFSGTRLKGWEEVLAMHAIVPQQQHAYTTGKNASDITLVIDAMDLLHTGRFDGFCLVSSDSDFTRLASRIREQGLKVYGFGERKTPESFRQACHRFIYTDNLVSADAAGALGAASPEKIIKKPREAVPTIKRAVKQIESEDDWVALGTVGQQLQKLEPDFDSRSFGSAKLSDLIEKTGAFEISRPADNKPVRIRIKPARTKAKAKAKPAA